MKILIMGSKSSRKHEMKVLENLEYETNIYEQKHELEIWYFSQRNLNTFEIDN